MQKTGNLEIIKAALTEKLNTLLEARDVLERESKEERVAIFEKVFSDELLSYPGAVIEESYGGVRFKVGGREVGSIEQSGWRADEKKISFNTYSTICDSESEFKRLVFNGKVAERLLNDMESIKGAFEIKFSKQGEIGTLSKEAYAIEREIDNLKEKIQDEKREEVMKGLKGEGIDWTLGNVFMFDRQWSSYQVKKVRVVSTTKSGKTADLEVSYANYGQHTNGEREELEDKIVTYQKVMMKYVMGNFRDTIYKQ